MDKIEANETPSLSSAESSALDSKLTNINANVDPSMAQAPDPQVKLKRPYTPKRTYSVAYKQRMLAAYDACRNAQERGELLRREGLYHSRICAWRKQQAAGKFNVTKGGKQAGRVDHLARENEQLKKKLAQAEAIIELQKKVSDLLGTHILPHEENEVT